MYLLDTYFLIIKNIQWWPNGRKLFEFRSLHTFVTDSNDFQCWYGAIYSMTKPCTSHKDKSYCMLRLSGPVIWRNILVWWSRPRILISCIELKVNKLLNFNQPLIDCCRLVVLLRCSIIASYFPYNFIDLLLFVSWNFKILVT